MSLYFDGRLLMALRANKGWTIAEFSKRTGLTRTTITALEQGRFKKRPKASTIKKVADAFGVSEIQFIRRDER